MSYRVYMQNRKDNGRFQILGNNEFPEELRKELNKQGAKIYPSKDYCFYDFEIKDINSIILVLEEYIEKIDLNSRLEGNGSLFNYSNFLIENRENGRLTKRVKSIVNFGYLFITYNIINQFKDDIESSFDENFNVIYKIKEGHHIYMSGF